MSDTAFDELIPADQRAALDALPHDRLLAECISALEDAALWHNCVQAEQAANAAWRRRCEELQAALAGCEQRYKALYVELHAPKVAS